MVGLKGLRKRRSSSLVRLASKRTGCVAKRLSNDDMVTIEDMIIQRSFSDT